jgi:hypothetical protein
MTGILPIRKYDGQSGLGFFQERSMIRPQEFAPFVGLTEAEVLDLCKKFDLDFEKMKNNYDGYQHKNVGSVFCPLSVTSAAMTGLYYKYWTNTDTFKSLGNLIKRDFDGLREDVVKILAGESVEVNTLTYQNDLHAVANRDDVLTALAHLGYLGFIETGEDTGKAFLPNWEVGKQYEAVLKTAKKSPVSKLMLQSEALLEATWRMDGDFVAETLDDVHSNDTSIFSYNNEISLSHVVSIAYFAAKDYYNIFPELPTGLGFADLAFVPQVDYREKPALLVELKWDASAESAIDQIKRKHYSQRLEGLTENLLLVGINYNKKTKKHECVIELADKSASQTQSPSKSRKKTEKNK